MSNPEKGAPFEQAKDPEKLKKEIANTQSLINLTALLNVFKKRGLTSTQIKQELSKIFK